MGLFVVFEGLTGSGKKTHMRLLTEKLRGLGKSVSVLSFPNYDEAIGKLTKKSGLDPSTQALLFAADRYFHQAKIEELLRKGDVVLCDRYSYSNYAYQSAAGVDIEWLKEIEKRLIKPHIAFLIDVPVELGIKRVQQSSLEEFTKKEIVSRLQRQRELLERVRKNFLRIARTNRETEWHVIDGRKSIDEVQSEIWEAVRKKL